MTVEEFLARFREEVSQQSLEEDAYWYLSSEVSIRYTTPRAVFCPVTFLAKAEGVAYYTDPDDYLEAGRALGLSREDATLIADAADKAILPLNYAPYHPIRKALLEAVFGRKE